MGGGCSSTNVNSGSGGERQRKYYNQNIVYSYLNVWKKLCEGFRLSDQCLISL